jgi:hypothetical protein
MIPKGGKQMGVQISGKNKISSGGGSITRRCNNAKQQDEWMPPKKHNPFEMPL